MSRRFIDRDEVARRLTYDLGITIVRDAIIAFFRAKRNSFCGPFRHCPKAAYSA
jgi:hypothetical protein